METETKHTRIAYLTQDGEPITVTGTMLGDVELAAMAIRGHHERNRAEALLKIERNELAAALTSIIEWWEDDHDKPKLQRGMTVDSPRDVAQSQWVERRMLLMANAARAALAKIEKEN